ncbi:MAG TPA: hypothetical protein VES40_10230 [Ilumatobacteraceae bacterium]|nr:hypothetical protein [Ilumatobacteraceae bacterium]
MTGGELAIVLVAVIIGSIGWHLPSAVLQGCSRARSASRARSLRNTEAATMSALPPTNPMIAVTATYGIGRWQLVGRWPHSTAARLAPEPLRHRQLVIGLGAAIAGLFLTAAWEANRISAAVG